MTENQKARVTAEWSKLAGEPVTVNKIGSYLHAHGSELACLRLEHKFRGSKEVGVDYSANLQTWFFSKSTAF